MIIIGKNLKKSDNDFKLTAGLNVNKDGYMLLIKWKNKLSENKLILNMRMYFNELEEWFDLDEISNKEVIKWERVIKNTGEHSLPFRLPTRANDFELTLNFVDSNSLPITDSSLVGEITLYALPIMSH